MKWSAGMIVLNKHWSENAEPEQAEPIPNISKETQVKTN